MLLEWTQLQNTYFQTHHWESAEPRGLYFHGSGNTTTGVQTVTNFLTSVGCRFTSDISSEWSAPTGCTSFVFAAGDCVQSSSNKRPAATRRLRRAEQILLWLPVITFDTWRGKDVGTWLASRHWVQIVSWLGSSHWSYAVIPWMLTGSYEHLGPYPGSIRRLKLPSQEFVWNNHNKKNEKRDRMDIRTRAVAIAT